MQIIKPARMEWDPLDQGIGKRTLFKSDHLEILELRLDSGQALKPHDMPCRVVFRVLEGKGILNVDGTPHAVDVEDSVFLDPGPLRYWSNPSPGTLRLLVTKSLREPAGT